MHSSKINQITVKAACNVIVYGGYSDASIYVWTESGWEIAGAKH